MMPRAKKVEKPEDPKPILMSKGDEDDFMGLLGLLEPIKQDEIIDQIKLALNTYRRRTANLKRKNQHAVVATYTPLLKHAEALRKSILSLEQSLRLGLHGNATNAISNEELDHIVNSLKDTIERNKPKDTKGGSPDKALTMVCQLLAGIHEKYVTDKLKEPYKFIHAALKHAGIPHPAEHPERLKLITYPAIKSCKGT